MSWDEHEPEIVQGYTTIRCDQSGRESQAVRGTHAGHQFNLPVVISWVLAVLAATTTTSGQVATWNGGTGDYHTGSNWSGGVVPNGPSFDVFIDGGNGVNSIVDGAFNTSTTVNSLTIDSGDLLRINNNSDFFVESLIDNDGELRLNTLGNLTDMILTGDVILFGAGSLTLTSSATRVRGGGHLTNFGNTIQGWGTFGNNDLQFTNLSGGFVNANISGQTLTVDPNANGIVNQGTFRASSGGVLLLTGATIDNTSGTIEALAGSSVMINNTDVTDGIWMSTGSGTIQIAASSTVTATDMINLATIVQNNNTDFYLDGTIDNQGFINVTSLGNLSDVYIDNTTTLEGGGTIRLNLSACRIVDPSGANGVLINVDNLLEGRGVIGVNTMQLINEPAGIVDANDAAGSLTLDPPSGSPMINQGVFQASNQGHLILSSGDFENTGALIEAQNMSTVTLTNVSVNEGTLRSLGSGTIEIPFNTSVTVTNPTLIGTINQANNSDFIWIGDIDNQADINVTTLGNLTDIVIDEAVTLSGGGTITMSGSSTCRVVDLSGSDGVLTNVDHLFQGRGQIGANTLQFINQLDGVIDANDPAGNITLDPAPNSPMVNRGLIKASNGGSLILNPGDYDNLSSLILAEAGTSMTLNSGVSVTSGTLRSEGSGTIEIPGSATVTITDLVLEGTVNQANNTDFVWIGDINNRADINVNTLGNLTDIVIDDAVTLFGGGTITMSGSSTCRVVDQSGSDGVLTNVDHLFQGRGNIGANTLQFINQVDGVIHANDPAGGFTLDPRPGDPMINRGLIKASNGSSLVIAAGEIDNAGSLIVAETGTTITLSTGSNVVGGTLRSEGTATIEIVGNTSPTVTELTLEGTVNQGNNSDFNLVGAIENNANITVETLGNHTDIACNSPVVINGTGTINLTHFLTRLDGTGEVELAGGTLTGIGQVNLPSRFTGSTIAPGNSIGTLTFNTDTQLVNASSIEIELGALNGTPGADWDLLDIGGTLDLDDDILDEGVLIKAITLDGNGDPGPLAGFQPLADYSWLIAHTTGLTGFDPSVFTYDLNEFANTVEGAFTTNASGNDVVLTYLGGAVCLDSGVVAEGFGNSGTTFANTCLSDNIFWQAHGATFAYALTDPVVQFEATATAPGGYTGGPFRLHVEGRKENGNGNLNVTAKIWKYNDANPGYRNMPGVLVLQTNDLVKTYELPVGAVPLDYVESGTGEVRILLQIIQTSGLPNVRAQLDQVLVNFD